MKGRHCGQDDSLVWGLSWACLHLSAETPRAVSDYAATRPTKALQARHGSQDPGLQASPSRLTLSPPERFILAFTAKIIFKKRTSTTDHCCSPQICTFRGPCVYSCISAKWHHWRHMGQLRQQNSAQLTHDTFVRREG